MRADRLLSMLLLLQVHRRMTAHNLAQRLEVSERTIYRDMEALSSAGIPIVAERGTGGGLVLPEAFRTNLTGLSSPEIQALFLGRPAHLLSDLGLSQASEAALIKLLAVLPSVYRRNAEHVRQRIHVDVAGWQRSGEDISFLPVIQEAIWQERKLLMVYRRGEQSVERQLDPLGLVAKGRIWYLVAAVEGEVRTYRISRIHEVYPLEEPCVRPADFDLAAYWEVSSADFVANLPRYGVTVRVSPQALSRIQHVGRFIQIEQIDAPGEDGWVKIRINFEIKDEACGYLLGFGPELEIVDPPELRAQLIHLAESLLAFYAQRS